MRAACLSCLTNVRPNAHKMCSNLVQKVRERLRIRMRMRVQLVALLLCLACGGDQCIVHTTNETANMTVYMLPAEDVGPATWKVAVDCLDSFAQIFFYRNPQERYTRAYNLMLTNIHNMSMPAAQIQQRLSRRINEAISDPEALSDREYFQLRVISDKPSDNSTKIYNELVLADNYIIVVDSVEVLHRLMSRNVKKSRSWNPGARFLVLFHNTTMRDKPWTVASKIFGDLMRTFYVHRVALVFANSSMDYNLLVNDYYSNVECRKLSVQSVGQCNSGELHPSRSAVKAAMSDYISGFSPRNCTFYVCASIAAPFVEDDCVLGIEMRILGFMRNRLQFMTNETCSRDSRGELENDGSWNGLLGKLDNNECDFIMGGFYPDNEVIDYFWGTDCYLQDAHTWYTKLADERPAWRAMIGIFALYTWLGILGTLLVTWLFWYFLMKWLPEPRYYQPLSLTAINTLAVSLCIAVQERPICDATRVFFVALTLYGINVISTYTSKMIGTCQDPGLLHQIDDLPEVVAAGIPFGGVEESRDWFENDDDMWIFDAFNFSDDFGPRTQNLEAVKRGQRCILNSRMYMMQNQYADDIFAFKQNVFTSPMQLVMKAGFPFIYEFNMIIRYMRDVGIIQKIDKDFLYNNTYLNRIAKMRPEFAANVIVLTTEHMKGPFGILIVGSCIAILTFLGELVSGYCRCRRRKARRLRGGRWHRERQQVSKAVAPVVRFTPVKRRKVL